MAFDISWYLDQRILALNLSGNLTFEELDVVTARMQEVYLKRSAPIHTLIDLRQVEQYPQLNIKQLVKHFKPVAPDDTSWIIIITSNKMLRFLASMFFQINPRKFHAVDTIDAAMSFLLARDGTLDGALLTALITPS